jgi:hypothetical protein
MFTLDLFSNRLIWAGIVLELIIILLIDYTRWGNLVFGTAAIAALVWLFILPFAVGMMILEELRKWLVRRMGRPVVQAMTKFRLDPYTGISSGFEQPA